MQTLSTKSLLSCVLVADGIIDAQNQIRRLQSGGPQSCLHLLQRLVRVWNCSEFPCGVTGTGVGGLIRKLMDVSIDIHIHTCEWEWGECDLEVLLPIQSNQIAKMNKMNAIIKNVDSLFLETTIRPHTTHSYHFHHARDLVLPSLCHTSKL